MKAQRLAAIIVAGLLVASAAGAGAWYLITSPNAHEAPAIVNDGPTFYDAAARVNASVLGVTGGPWMLSVVFGVASPLPSSPSAWGWPGTYPQTMASCQAAFHGLTIWNGSIPLFHGTFNSGTAPFWQFVFFSNATHQLLVATDVRGIVQVFPPIGMESQCGVSSGLGYEPWVSSWAFYRWAFPTDTPAMAAAAWGAVGSRFVSWLGVQPTEMYLLGGINFGSGQPAGTQTAFFTCGTVGSAGVTKGLDVFTDPYDTAVVTGWNNYTLGCTPTYNNWTAVPVDVSFSNTTYEVRDTGTQASQSFQLVAVDNATTRTNVTLGITSWMVGLNLVGRNGTSLPVGYPTCSQWVASVSECTANQTGWFAVLLSGSGGWQGVFGRDPTGVGWSYPVIPLASGQTLVVVVPTAWDLSGATLATTSDAPPLPLTGSTTFPPMGSV